MQFPDTVTVKITKRVSKRKTVVTEEQHPARHYGLLAVHQITEPTKYSKAGYRVTHRPTGLLVANELTINQAIRIAKDLAEMPEWSEPSLGEGRTIGNTFVMDRLREAVIDARRRHGADHDYNLRRKYRI